MGKVIEEQLRQLFQEKAEEFAMDQSMPPGVIRRARRRIVNGFVAGLSMITAAVLLWVLASGSAVRPERDDLRAATISLVAYVNADKSPGEHGRGHGEEDQSTLRRFSECMQRAGFSVPDPVRTERGWTIPVRQRPGDTPEWREAAFVTCRPANVHLTGDLVLGGRTAGEIETFTACMQQQGYDLPAPSRAEDAYSFDLRGTEFDTDSDAFHRAVFVACHHP